MFFLFLSFPVSPHLPFQSCYLGPGDALPLEMSIVVAVENSSRQPEENTQALLDHLSIVYVATAESETTGKVGSYGFCCGAIAQWSVHWPLACLHLACPNTED